MAGLLKNRSALQNSLKGIKSSASRTSDNRASLTGGKSASSVASTIEKIKLTTKQYLSKYESQYLLLRDEESVKSYFDKIVDTGIAAIDTETTGLDTMTCDIVGLCLYIKREKPCYIPIGHIGNITHNLLPGQLSKQFIKSQLDRCKDVKWVLHNAKYDMRVIYHTVGCKIRPYWDTMIAAKLLNENESAALKNLHLKYCDSQDEKALTISNLFDGLNFSLIPMECAYLYAAGDAIKTYELYEFQKKYLDSEKLKGPRWVFDNLELPLIEVLASMEDTGVLVDQVYADKLKVKYHKLLADAEKACYDCLDQYKGLIDMYKRTTPNHKLSNPIALSSPTQIAILLYDILQLKPKGHKDFGRGTGEQVISLIDHDFPKLLLKYREISKLITTYVDKLPAVVNESTHRIHPSFNAYGAATGRTSSSEPNLQNVPSHNTDIRKMFVAPEGSYFVSGDFSLLKVG